MLTKKSVAAFAALILAVVACQTPFQNAPASATTPIAGIPTVVPNEGALQNPTENQDVLVGLYERVSPGTVAIITDQGQGSGFVYDSAGHIITNYHVVEGARAIEVRFTSGFMSYGTVIGTDLDSDIAVVKVDAPAEELHPVPLGDSDALKVGQTVIAIGNPFGLNTTMTVGIVSAVGRTLDSAHQSPDGGIFTAGDIIQTDAAINPGNSGGPLFNINGEVVGVNRAIISNNTNVEGQPTNSGIGFAVSVNIVKRVTPTLIKDGKYDYPYLGISSINSLTLEMVDALKLKQYTGAYVTKVAAGSPADQAGVKAGEQQSSLAGLPAGGDLITAIDGREVRTFDELLSYLITNKGPGDTIVLTVLRGEEKVDINVTLGKRP
ncbi:MAG: trypsin-like peptidase domain-containing protein [Anaerolineales bacterium]|nr:trypsin-like peptidase domain-containing protein [Anaerolineales bacterium]MCZ2122499.1 trypsin-like peptidase domain-containing protein [Anaerolineales bacterium]